MADIKEYAYNLEKELEKTIGFKIPNKMNVKISDDTPYYASDGKNIKISTKTAKEFTNNGTNSDFAVAHEFAHIIQGFLIETKFYPLPDHNMREQYERALNQYFGTHNIKISQEEYNKFSKFVNQSMILGLPHNNLLFDNKFYVNRENLNDENIMSRTNEKTQEYVKSLIDKEKIAIENNEEIHLKGVLYVGNLQEVHADTFAIRILQEKYIAENDIEKLSHLTGIVQDRLKEIDVSEIYKTKESFDAQVDVVHAILEAEAEKVNLEQKKLSQYIMRNKMRNIMNEYEKLEEQGVSTFSTHGNFNRANEAIKDAICELKSIKRNLCSILENHIKENYMNKGIKITFANDFDTEANKTKYHATRCESDILGHFNGALNHAEREKLKEVVVDIQNLVAGYSNDKISRTQFEHDSR